MDAAQSNRAIWDRAIGAARLDSATYEEVERDPGATREAAIVVIVTSLLAGIGAGLAGGPLALVIGVLVNLLGWASYAFITYFIGTRLLAGPETSASWSELARTLGYASAPRALLAFTFIPVLAGVIVIAVAIWVLVATVIALRAALDFSTARAIGTAVIGWLVQGVLMGIALAV